MFLTINRIKQPLPCLVEDRQRFVAGLVDEIHVVQVALDLCELAVELVGVLGTSVNGADVTA